MKHTEGVWESRIGKNGFDIEIIAGASLQRRPIAVVDGYADEESNANAKLIVSAPELAKHGQYVIDAWEDYVQSGRKDIMEQFIAGLKTAIKKATA